MSENKLKRQYSAIFFDFDGTLADTAPGIVATMRETFKRMGLALPAEEAMRATIGMPLDKALGLLGHLDETGEKEAARTYHELFQEYELGALEIYPHVISTLSQLHAEGIRMAIVTSRDEFSLDLITKPRDMDRFFESRITGSSGLPHKPAPDLVLALLEKMNLKAEEVLVVGDTTFDIIMGNRAGCDTCAVTYGNHSRETLLEANPTYIIDSFDKILISK